MGKPNLTAEQRAMALRLRAKGLNFKEIGEQIDASLQTAWDVVMKPPTRTVWTPGPGRLTPLGPKSNQVRLVRPRPKRRWRSILKDCGRIPMTLLGKVASVGTVTRCLWISQIVLSGLLVLCSAIAPSVVSSDGGVSNFGNRLATVVPYTLSFSLCFLFLSLAAAALAKVLPAQQWYALALAGVAVLDLLVLVSTYPRHINLLYSEVHDDLGIALFAYEFVLSIWLSVRGWGRQAAVFFLIEAGGSLVGLLSILKVVHLLYYGQMVGGIGFGLLLVRVLPRICGSADLRVSES